MITVPLTTLYPQITQLLIPITHSKKLLQYQSKIPIIFFQQSKVFFVYKKNCNGIEHYQRAFHQSQHQNKLYGSLPSNLPLTS